MTSHPGVRAGLVAGVVLTAVALMWPSAASCQSAPDAVPTFDRLLAHRVALKPELAGVHPRVFVTAAELAPLRIRARTTHKDEWARALATLAGPAHIAPPPAPGSQERRAQNNVALAIAGLSLAYAIEQDPKYLAAARAWTLTAIDYEPWGYTFDKPNTDLAAGHLLYAISWAYDLLYDTFTPEERTRIRRALERHADLLYDAFAPAPGRRFAFTQNHNYIPTAGLAVAALALMGESPNAEKWAAVARAHHHRAGQLLSADGFNYEGMEYFIFAAPWLVHFLDAWEHSTGESLWDRGQFRNWKYMIAHVVMPDGQAVFDFGDIWQGPLTRAKQGADYAREYPTGTLKSNFNVLYRVAARFEDPQTQAVAARCASFGHTNQEEWWTLLWRDPGLAAAPMSQMPLAHHFEDSGIAFYRTSWDKSATAFALKAGPPEGHRAATLFAAIPEWRPSNGHAHPDAPSFIIWTDGRYAIGDTGYAGQPQARHHNTITVAGQGQGHEGGHDVWESLDQGTLDGIRITAMKVEGAKVRIEADAAAAYPAAAALTRFHRVFTFDGARGFTVEDSIALRDAKPIEWFLHADTPVQQDADRFLFAGGLVVATVDAPAGSKTTVGQTVLTAPGRPGSITAGPEEQRGYQLMLQTPAATTVTIRAQLTVQPQSPPSSTRSGTAAGQAPAFSVAIERARVLEVMHAAADWQLDHPSTHAPYEWTQAAFYTGMMALGDVTTSPKYVDAMKAMGQKNLWRPGLRPGHADDYAVIATYARMFQREKDAAMLAPALALFNFLATRKYDEPLAWGGAIETRELAWCDALFMGPPAMAAVTVATGDRKYLDLANRLWWKTTDYLFDKDEKLYFRDSRYFEQREQNGRKVFWSRGNGWVIAGLARMLRDMPPDYPDRGRYVTLFKEIAGKVRGLQSADGYWRSSLLDPDSRPNPETSGTGFFTYALAWGINQGLLDRASYEPGVRRGWEAMVRAVHADGMLGWVQPIGAEPGSTTFESTEVYGVGALLLAGSEVLRLGK